MAKNPVGRPRRFKETQIVEALRLSAGIISNAARILGCDRKTLDRAIAASSMLQEVKAEADKSIIDMAVATIVKAVQKGDVSAAKFVLVTKGKNDGWTTRPDAVDGGKKIRIYLSEEDMRL